MVRLNGQIISGPARTVLPSSCILVADDLFNPHFKITRMQAVRARLVRNYWAIYLVLVGAWCVHVLTFSQTGGNSEAQSWTDVRETLSGGMLPWWFPLSLVVTVVIVLVSIGLGVRPPTRSDEEAWLDPELAVARGAAYYARARRSGGLRIRGGIAQSYYIGIERAELAVPGMPARMDAVCVAPGSASDLASAFDARVE